MSLIHVPPFKHQMQLSKETLQIKNSKAQAS